MSYYCIAIVLHNPNCQAVSFKGLMVYINTTSNLCVVVSYSLDRKGFYNEQNFNF